MDVLQAYANPKTGLDERWKRDSRIAQFGVTLRLLLITVLSCSHGTQKGSSGDSIGKKVQPKITH